MNSILDHYPQRPDWLLCGIPIADGRVRLIASKRLSHAELRAEYRRNEIYVTELSSPIAHPITYADISLTAHMYPRSPGDLVLVEGPTYKDVLSQLEIVCSYCGSCIIGTTCKICGSPRQQLIGDKK